MSDESSANWYAIQVKQRRELVIAETLRTRGYDPFVPLCRCVRVWADRVKPVQLPLFPGYIFCRFDPANRRPIVLTLGVIQIVGYGKRLAPIAPEEIHSLQVIAASDRHATPFPYLDSGERVRILCGPLAGVEGIFVTAKNEHRVVVSITLLQRSVAVELAAEWVASIDGTKFFVA